ncbi:MAG TPA: DAK2 domain-containing protein [Actinomycetes bacterium]
MVEVLDAAAIRRWCEVSLDGLARAREEIDWLNVYPVPDADTGTNLFLTMEATAAAVAQVSGDDLPAVLRAMADGALLGAKGNSGVITSQLLRGLAVELASANPAGGAALAAALTAAAELSYAAVAVPVEGTILTVARAAAVAAKTAGVVLSDVAAAAADGAAVALAKTPDQLDVLARAGVVDAGGRGLCVIFDSLAEVVSGAAPAERLIRVRDTAPRAQPRLPEPGETASEPAAGGPAYEVMYLLDAADEAVPALKATLGPLGDSLVVVGGGGLWNVHIHVDDPGSAVEAGVEAGRPHRIRINNLTEATHRRRRLGPRQRAVITLAPAAGLAAIFEQAGATVVAHEVDGAPRTASLADAITDSGAREIVMVADGASTVPAIQAAAAQARADGIRVAVIPARSSVQAIAALAVHEPSQDFDADVIAMSGAAGTARHAEVTVATQEAVTSAGLCHPGDVLGLIDGDIALIGADIAAVAAGVIERMLDAGGELVTLITGADAPAGVADRLVRELHTRRPEVEWVVYDGGQDVYPLLIGVE